ARHPEGERAEHNRNVHEVQVGEADAARGVNEPGGSSCQQCDRRGRADPGAEGHDREDPPGMLPCVSVHSLLHNRDPSYAHHATDGTECRPGSGGCSRTRDVTTPYQQLVKISEPPQLLLNDDQHNIKMTDNKRINDEIELIERFS